MPIPVSALPPGFNIAELAGPILLAYLFHWGLFATLGVQLYLYYEAFPNDRLANKVLVYGICIFEFVQTMLVTHDAFAMFAYGFGDVEALTNMHFNWLTVPIMSGIVAFIGQAFYAFRIHVLSKSWVIPVLIICISLTSTVGGLITGVYSFEADNVTLLNNRRTSTAVGVWCGAAALCDILIAFSMMYYLTRLDTGFRQTRVLVARLVRLTLETGSITALVALANLVLFFAFPGKSFYGTPALIMPKLYANTILVVLNSRFEIVGGRSASSGIIESGMTGATSSGSNVRDAGQRMGRLRAPVVEINREVFSRSDNSADMEMKALGSHRNQKDSYA